MRVDNLLRILTFHRIANTAALCNPAVISATPTVFRAHAEYLARNWRVVSLLEVIEAVETERPLVNRAVLLTFDDGYKDFGETAWPILREFGLPAVLFVPTAYPGNSHRTFWWDRLYVAVMSSRDHLLSPELPRVDMSTDRAKRSAYRTLRNHIKTLPHAVAMETVERICASLENRDEISCPVLNWQEIRELAADGVTIAAHSRTHPLLTQVSESQVQTEVEGSQEDLRRELGYTTPAFCYPNGTHNDTVVRYLKRAGYVLGFTTVEGHNRLHSADLLRLHRTNVTLRTSTAVLGWRLSTIGSYVYDQARLLRDRSRSRLSLTGLRPHMQ